MSLVTLPADWLKPNRRKCLIGIFIALSIARYIN